MKKAPVVPIGAHVSPKAAEPPRVPLALLEAWRNADKALCEARHIEQQARAQLLEAVVKATGRTVEPWELGLWECSTPAELGAFAGEWPILVSDNPFVPVFEIDERGHIQGAAQ